MSNDEQAIRSLVANWMKATLADDLPRVLELMDDEVVFLGAGRPPMRGKAAFAASSRARARDGAPRIEGSADIQEVCVFGDWAYCWNQISVSMHPAGGGDATHMSGPAVAILRKTPDGGWVIFRDANMVTPTSTPPTVESTT